MSVLRINFSLGLSGYCFLLTLAISAGASADKPPAAKEGRPLLQFGERCRLAIDHHLSLMSLPAIGHNDFGGRLVMQRVSNTQLLNDQTNALAARLADLRAGELRLQAALRDVARQSPVYASRVDFLVTRMNSLYRALAMSENPIVARDFRELEAADAMLDVLKLDDSTLAARDHHTAVAKLITARELILERLNRQFPVDGELNDGQRLLRTREYLLNDPDIRVVAEKVRASRMRLKLLESRTAELASENARLKSVIDLNFSLSDEEILIASPDDIARGRQLREADRLRTPLHAVRDALSRSEAPVYFGSWPASKPYEADLQSVWLQYRRAVTARQEATLQNQVAHDFKADEASRASRSSLSQLVLVRRNGTLRYFDSYDKGRNRRVTMNPDCTIERVEITTPGQPGYIAVDQDSCAGQRRGYCAEYARFFKSAD